MQPKLTFIMDTSIKDGFEMVQKLNKLEAEEAAVAGQADVISESSDVNSGTQSVREEDI